MSNDKINPQKDKTPFLDAAIIFTIVTSILYILGWVYWVSYYKFFGISSDFINIPFEQIVSTTWIIGLGAIIALISLIGLYIFDINNTEDYSFELSNIITFLSFLGGVLAVIYYYKNIWLSFVVIIPILVILYLASKTKLFNYTIIFGKFYQKKSTRLCIILLIFFIFFFTYSYMGEQAAEIQSKSHNTKIILETTGGWQSPKDAFLIAHMDNKYFIYNSSNDSFAPEVFIIEDAQVSKVTLLRNK
jgi:hypothetical protein